MAGLKRAMNFRARVGTGFVILGLEFAGLCIIRIRACLGIKVCY